MHTIWGTHRETEVFVHLKDYGLIMTTKTWWNSSHYWSGAIAGYRLFKKD